MSMVWESVGNSIGRPAQAYAESEARFIPSLPRIMGEKLSFPALMRPVVKKIAHPALST